LAVPGIAAAPTTCATYATDPAGNPTYYTDDVGAAADALCANTVNLLVSNLIAPFDPDIDLPPGYFWLCSYWVPDDHPEWDTTRVWTDTAHLRSAEAQCAGAQIWRPGFEALPH
jgi:hypothetical protein